MIRSGLIAALLAAVLQPNALAQDSTRVTSERDPGIQLLRSMVEANPDVASYRIRLAGALFEDGRYAESAEHYAEYISGVQASPQIVRNYLFALTQTEGALDAGEQTASKYARIYPTDAEIQTRLGYFRLWQGKYTAALEACRRALRLEPDNEQAGACADRAADPPAGSKGSTLIDRLLRDLSTTGENDPDLDDKRFRLVSALSDAGRYQEAWDQLLVLEPEHGRSARWLDAFLTVEAGMARPDGSSPMYAPDRYTYLVRARPDDRTRRLHLVDLLIDEERFAEALTVLTAPGRLDVGGTDYAHRLRRIVGEREAHARRRIAALTEDPAGASPDPDDLVELASHYATLGRGRDAVAACDRLTATRPAEAEPGAWCMGLFTELGYEDRAVVEADRLVRLAPTDEKIQRQVLITRLRTGRVDSETQRRLDRMLADVSSGAPDSHTSELVLAAAAYFVGEGQIDRADSVLDRLPQSNTSTPYVSRRESIEILIESERIRRDVERTNELLREARRLFADGQYVPAVTAYERYFEERGARTRPELLELASVHTAAGDHERALSILEALEDRFHDADVTKRIARVRMDMGDAGGALAALDRLIAERPQDREARLWRADVLAGLGYHGEALAIYDSLPEGTGETFAVAARRAVVVNDARGAGAVGDWSGLDYAGILAPNADGVRARGGGTAYDRWGQGMQTHVTTPIGLVVLAGIDSHFLSGTRRLVPDSETVAGRINRIWAGGIFDFKPQIASDRASYTSRLSFEGGLFDYEGGRTMPFGSVRYWRQQPGVYDGSIGLRTTEGSIDLWSPAGGQYDLRLTQINAKGTTTALAADSTIRVAANVSLNLITDNLGSTLDGERNTGSNIRLEAGYRIANDTYLGVEYLGIDFRSTVDIYWSPQNYSQYDVFLEYEGESPLRWYLRLRAAVGMVARSDGFVTRRMEADWIRRLDDNFSISIRTGLSASARSSGSAGSSVLDRYRSATFGAALYWTL